MKGGIDGEDFIEGALDAPPINIVDGKLLLKAESPNDSSPQSDAALPPSEKSSAGELGPETSVSNASVVSPNQEIRSSSFTEPVGVL